MQGKYFSVTKQLEHQPTRSTVSYQSNSSTHTLLLTGIHFFSNEPSSKRVIFFFFYRKAFLASRHINRNESPPEFTTPQTKSDNIFATWGIVNIARSRPREGFLRSNRKQSKYGNSIKGRPCRLHRGGITTKSRASEWHYFIIRNMMLPNVNLKPLGRLTPYKSIDYT